MTAAQHGTVIVTGSSGFIGAALINKLSSGFSLVGFDRMASSAPPPAAECICIDLISEDAVKHKTKPQKSSIRTYRNTNRRARTSPLAEAFPLWADDSFMNDIRDHGVRLPIVLFEGKILDGCESAPNFSTPIHSWG
jgi:hypothetical protein